MKIKNIFVILLSVLVLSSVALSFVAHADDEDDEDEDDDRYEEIRDEDDDAASTEERKVIPAEEIKMITRQIIDPPRTIVVNELQTISLPDRDYDGIPDETDPHPDVAEIYVVSDANLNGIVDAIE